MKTAQRLVAMMLILVLLMGNGGIVALADAVLTMPAALQIIDEEAFYGSTSIDRVVLSNKVTEIRSRAFANSTLSEINLPSSITYIAEDAFDGPDKVTVSATEGTYAYRWAVEHGYISEEIEVIDFTVSPDMLTLTVGSTYTLSASFVPSNATTVSITWGSSKKTVATVNNGTITAKAEGTAIITAIAENGLTATCEVTVVRSIPAPVITSAEQDGMGTVTLAWNSQGTGYEYLVYELIDDALVLLGATTNSTYTTHVASAGVHKYCVQACIHNDNDVLVSSDESAPYDVDIQIIWSFGASIEKIEQTSQDAASITWRGVSPVSYYEIAEVIGNNYTIIANNLTGDTTTISTLTQGVHRFAIRSVYNDQNNKIWVSSWSTIKAIEILSRDALAPSAPVLVFSDPGMEFSTTEANAPKYDKGSIEVAWIENENAQSYAITIEKKTASGYSMVFEENDIVSTAYVISSSIFADINESTVYRFGICSQGEISGDYAYSYFVVSIPDVSISISSTRWERTSRFAGSRTFTVSSVLPWIASSDSDWIKVFQYENNLEVSLSENATRRVRTGNVTLSNGENSAVITVVQDSVSLAPVLSVFGQTLSTDINNPTEIPAGGFSLAVEDNSANRVLMRFYQKSNGSYGNWKRWLNTKDSSVVYPYEWGSITFSSGKEFCIEASGHYSSDTNLYADYESLDDAPTQKYYIRMVDSGHYVLLNGQESLAHTIYLETEVQLLTSNSWTATSDCSWLTFTNSKETDVRKQKLYITAEANYSGTNRTGHITVTCGSTNAVITLNQPDLTPRIISPTNLSQTESSPTSVGAGTFAYTAIGAQMNWDYKSGSSWVNAMGIDAYTWDEGIDESYIDAEIFESGKTYRLTISDASGRSSIYYLKRSSTSSSYIKLKTEHYHTNETYYALNKPSGASTETVTLSSSGSWSITSDSSWLTVSPSSGTKGSNKDVTVSAATNSTTSERSGILSFKIGSVVYAKLKITQAAYGTDYVNVTVDYIPVDQTSALDHVTGAGDSLDIYPYSPGGSGVPDERIKAVSSVDWITVKDEMLSGKTAGVKVSENTTGSRRNGTITFTYGSASKTITITQEPKVGSITLSSPSLSTSSSSPTVLTYSDSAVVLKWNKATNAAKYNLIFRYVDSENIDSYYLYLDDTGSVNTVTLQADWFDPAYTGKYRVRIVPVDAYGNEGTAQYWYFTRAASNAVYINGKAALAWDNVTDLGATEEYSIASSAAWTASTNASWITLGSTSGSSGDTICITAAPNSSTARTGKVTITSGSASAILTVNQCAVLPEFPALKTPVFSDDIANPTVWSKANTLTVSWDVEPQANSYEVRLGSVNNASTTSVIEKSGTLKNKGTYTFNTSGLTEGQTYKITLIRSAENADGRVRSTGSSYYFTITPAVPFLKIDGADSASLSVSDRTFEADGTEDHIRYTITSSGTWSATVSDPSWIMVAKTVKTAQYLAENGMESSDYEQYVGNSGDSFYISLLENNTGNTRNGTVTITTAGVSTTIIVTQEQYYVLPEITSPSLAIRPSESVEIPFNSLALQWTAGEGNTGVYNIYLYEKDGSSYTRVYKKTNIITRSFTIPSSELEENTYYRLILGTELENSGETEGKYYYFHTDSANSLTISASVDWSQVDNGGYVKITASASGGAGNYYYAYQLLLDGVIEQQTTWETLKYYQFKPWSNGNYQVKVIAKDSTEKQVSYTSNYTKDDENTISVATANHYTASLDSSYQFLDYSVLSQRSWSVTSYPDWITPSVTSVSFSGDIRLIVAKNDGVTRIGKVEFQSNTGIISDLTITQSGSRSVAMVATEETFTNEAQTIDVSFATSDRWTASSDSSWATVNTKSGTSGNRTITVSLSENTDTTERTATISVISNGDIGQYTIHQLGKAVEQSGLKLSATSWLVSSTAAESKTITITTNGNWGISSIPAWMSSNVSTGSGNGELSLYCSSNTDQNARSGIVTITSGSLTQSINVSQPGNDVIATVVGFTLSNSTVDTGTKVNFTVITKNADQVQLLVDDIAYNKYDVVDNQVTFTRAFSQGGTRKITIMPIRMGENGLVSDAKYLTVNSNGTLDKPSFSIAPDNDYVGVAATITIPKVNNADTYTIRVYAPNSSLIVDALQVSESELASNNRKITIDAGTLLFEGVYSVNIIASGEGYSQSEDGNIFTRNARNYSISFSAPNDGSEYVSGDTIYATINQTGGGYASIKVVSPSGGEIWYPASDNHTTAETSFTAYIPVEESGTYSIYGYVFALNLPASQNVVQKEVQITVKAKGPEISRINIAEYGKTYTWIYQAADTNLYVTTNSAVERVTIKDSLSENAVSTSNYSLDGWNRLFTVKIPNNSAGSHSILITAIDEDTNKSTTATVDFYIAAPVNNYTAYTSTDVSIVSSPISGRKVADVLGGAYFEPVTVTHNAGDWLKVSDYLGNSGFIKSSSLSQSVPANASGNITIVSPTANETLPKGTTNTISIRWKSGIAINSQPNLTAILKNSNTGTTYTLNSSALFNSQFAVSSVPDGQYSVYLQMKNAAGTTVKSNTVEFILGGYSDEAYYKEWFKNEIYPWYSNYLESMGLYMDSRAMDAIQEANRFVVGGFVSDGNHWWKVLNNEELSSWITMSETERKQMNLTLVANLVLEDEAKANNKLKADMSNVSNVVATVQNNSVVNAQVQVVFSGIKTTLEALRTWNQAMDLTSAATYGLSPTEASNLSKAVDKWVDRIVEIAEDLVTDTVKDYNNEALLEAYKKEYAKAMKLACKEYVEYLEITLFGEIGASSKVNINTLDDRQKAALTYINAYKQYMTNDAQLQKDAVTALLKFCDSTLTVSQLSRDSISLKDVIIAQFTQRKTYADIADRLFDYLAEDVTNAILKKFNLDSSLNKAIAKDIKGCIRAFIWNDSANWFKSPDWSALDTKIRTMAAKYTVVLSASSFLSMLCDCSVTKVLDAREQRDYRDNNLEVPSEVKADNAKLKTAIGKAAFNLCKQAWKTGTEIAGLIGDVAELNSQNSGRAMFEMYGVYMAGAFKYRLTYTSGAMVLNFNWDYLSTLSVKELEQKRAGLITLMNNDVDALTYYRNMRTVNENANWKFHLVLRDTNGNETDRYVQSDYASYALIDAQIDWINAVKKWMVKVPSDIQVIINKYK